MTALILIPTHVATCISDDSAIALVEGPYGRCSCEVLTCWLDATEGTHICLDCQADLDWTLPFPVALMSGATLEALEDAGVLV